MTYIATPAATTIAIGQRLALHRQQVAKQLAFSGVILMSPHEFAG
jgi:hypothetical protein